MPVKGVTVMLPGTGSKFIVTWKFVCEGIKYAGSYKEILRISYGTSGVKSW
jgi:hypothetical protein